MDRLAHRAFCLIVVTHFLAGAAEAVPPNKELRAARSALARGSYAEAEQRFRALLAGGSMAARLGLGRVELDTGRCKEAERSAEAAAKIPRYATRAHTLLGEALACQGKLDAAERAFSLAAGDPLALRARVLLGQFLQDRGKAPQAEPHLLAVIDAYNNEALGEDRAGALCYVAMAARALGSVHDANEAFREAALADRSRVETQLQWASLFLSKYDFAHALESAEEALRHNPNSPEAHVLMARLALARSFNFPVANEHLAKASAVNPQLPSVHVTRAAIALREMDIEAAEQHLQRALAIHPHHLEALSVGAAARFLADDAAGFARLKQAVLERNPRFSRLFSIVAEYAEWEHRYKELVELARQALVIDPEDALAHATLGLNLLREGDEKRGLLALHEAWERDHFNVQVFNTLNLYEKVISQEYVTFTAPPFSLRMHQEERAVLEPYLVPMLQEAYRGMQKRYRFTPDGPLSIELYADPQHFSVRTSGLPNIGVQGVCFGKVVTALSPRGGPFNWGQITWHELAHVFHLQLSNNHVPRWFTEGLAEYETVLARPAWRREEDAQLWAALASNQVPKLRDFNKAFTQARTPQALMTAYYAASQAVAYIVTRFGFEKVSPMLIAWGKGMSTAQVFRETLGIELDNLDSDFRAHTKRRLSKYDDGRSDRYLGHLQLARKELAAQRAKAALKQAEAAIALDSDQLEAWRLLLEVAEKLGDQALGRRALTALAALDQHDKDAHLALMAVLHDAEDFKELERLGEYTLFLDPARPLVHSLLGEAYLRNHKPAQALTELDRALVLGAHNPNEIQLARARALEALGRRREARVALGRAAARGPKSKPSATP